MAPTCSVLHARAWAGPGTLSGQALLRPRVSIMDSRASGPSCWTRNEGREPSTLAVSPPGLLPPRGLQMLDVSQNSCSVTLVAQEEDTRAALTVGS